MAVGKLEKLTITPFKKQGASLVRDIGKRFSVQFNPNSYSIGKTVQWSQVTTSSTSGSGNEGHNRVNAPTLSFGGGGSRTLTLNLFFDVTEEGADKDVREETDKIVALTRMVSDVEPPPVCEIFWGKNTSKDFPFVGVVNSLTQNFTLFRNDGTPMRANLTVGFTEFLDPSIDYRQTDPELTTRVVKRGDSLSGIAAEVYRDPTQWRIIAEANRLDDPRRLEIGQRLTIPKTR
jgi:hypothetical protein